MKIMVQQFIFSMLAFGFMSVGLSCPCVAMDGDKKLPKYTVEAIGDSIEVINASKKVDGFWIYMPTEKSKAAKNVVLFMHGYGAYNPMIFGAWIRHLVADGHIVIYPRYQKTLYSPSPKKFVKNALVGIQDALRVLESRGVNSRLWSDLDVVGHSYGGVIGMNLAQNNIEFGLPPIKNLMICSAGTGPFKAGVLNEYHTVKANLIIVDSEHDTTVGDVFSKHVDTLTEGKQNKVYLHQKAMQAGDIRLSSHHNEPYALDMAFDNGVRNYTAKKALRVGQENILDHAGYWKLFDQLILQNEGFSLFDVSHKEWLLSEKFPNLRLLVH